MFGNQRHFRLTVPLARRSPRGAQRVRFDVFHADDIGCACRNRPGPSARAATRPAPCNTAQTVCLPSHSSRPSSRVATTFFCRDKHCSSLCVCTGRSVCPLQPTPLPCYFLFSIIYFSLAVDVAQEKTNEKATLSTRLCDYVQAAG